jgi:hypothetical protein
MKSARALAFSKGWATEERGHAEAKTFWDECFKVFGLSRRPPASFEEPVKNLGGNYSFIDLRGDVNRQQMLFAGAAHRRRIQFAAGKHHSTDDSQIAC